MWLHAGIIHLVVNMFSLVFIGIRLEQQFGFGKLCCPFISIENISSGKRQIRYSLVDVILNLTHRSIYEVKPALRLLFKKQEFHYILIL